MTMLQDFLGAPATPPTVSTTKDPCKRRSMQRRIEKAQMVAALSTSRSAPTSSVDRLALSRDPIFPAPISLSRARCRESNLNPMIPTDLAWCRKAL
jgi:hypothetical protein